MYEENINEISKIDVECCVRTLTFIDGTRTMCKRLTYSGTESARADPIPVLSKASLELST